MEDWKAKYIFEQIESIKTTARHEMAIIPNLLYSERLIELKPVTQKYVAVENGVRYYIDLYYPQLKLAIEVDEKHHNQQQEYDENRQQEIERTLGCKFIRFECDSETNHFNLIEEIISILEKDKKDLGEEFEVWERPKIADINTIFETVNNATVYQGKVDPTKGFYFPSRRISEDKREISKIGVGMSASTSQNELKYVTSIIEIDAWLPDEERNGYWYPVGREITVPGLTMSAYTGWPQGKNVLFPDDDNLE